MKSNKPILIISGDANSIFFEIFFKALKYKKYKNPIILISSLSLLKNEMKKFKFKSKINIIDYQKILAHTINNRSLNLIDIKNKKKTNRENFYNNSNFLIKKSFDIALKIISLGITNKLINGPISKKKFLNKKYLGITEYLGKKSNTKKIAMLIYNKELSVCPITTHLPLKMVSAKINKEIILEKVFLIDRFYQYYRKIKPRIGIVGLNPHCESIDSFNEDEKILKPVIKKLENLGYNISGPYPSDTIFLKKNRKKFNVIIGMYHDQVLAPLKTLYEYNAINITIGLPFLRISPDHGPNEGMVGKNKSSAKSLIQAITFLDKN
jgi:4-hydroxythreonine-4-phosphate dehydrogenase